jgi:hypothetical protein
MDAWYVDSPVTRVPHPSLPPRPALREARDTRGVLRAPPAARWPREHSVGVDGVAMLRTLPLLHRR